MDREHSDGDERDGDERDGDERDGDERDGDERGEHTPLRPADRSFHPRETFDDMTSGTERPTDDEDDEDSTTRAEQAQLDDQTGGSTCQRAPAGNANASTSTSRSR